MGGMSVHSESLVGPSSRRLSRRYISVDVGADLTFTPRRTDALRVLDELTSASRRDYVSPHALMFVHMGTGAIGTKLSIPGATVYGAIKRSRLDGCGVLFCEVRPIHWPVAAPDFDPLRPGSALRFISGKDGDAVRPRATGTNSVMTD